MNVGDMLRMMRDPLGAPFFPPVLQVLLIVTWVLHIFFVTLALGSSSLSIWGFLLPTPNRLRLARVAARLTPNAVGLGIVTGIAPLLFVQTIYDPIWYAANTLTGFWSVLFIFVVMGGYSLAYVFYLKGSPNGKLLWSAIGSFILLFFAGWVMHVLAAVSIRPERWLEWYASNGIVDTRGMVFHAYNLPRLFFLLPLQAGLSLAVVLMLFGWYFRHHEADAAFMQWVAELGRRLGLVISPLYAMTGLLWAATEGRAFGIGLPLGIVLPALGTGLTAYFFVLKQPLRHAPRSLLVWIGTLLSVGVIREVIRAVSLARFGYSVAEYPYRIDWGSVVIFSVTTVVGVMVISYLVLVLYRSGGGNGDTQPSPRVERFGAIATGMLGAWFGFFLLVGLYATFFLK
ncbi:hypothetical protein [Chloroflexus aggregans]|uniref:Uncharacterized protein n=1 Tax=Chloroflexus aggregans (strain MD-66 / DSM 9485) TaxID=326427 RepID=B8G4R2_CHLAD|nr:hypothetical protein [Chloroflexus aggregans]ACL25538.1 conserved hypothetical protein [Chloroflexus aggregans DSM 9485]